MNGSRHPLCVVHLSSVSCLSTSPIICPTPLCNDLRSSSLLSKSFVKSLRSSRTERGDKMRYYIEMLHAPNTHTCTQNHSHFFSLSSNSLCSMSFFLYSSRALLRFSASAALAASAAIFTYSTCGL